jgi:hypothetical protein
LALYYGDVGYWTGIVRLGEIDGDGLRIAGTPVSRASMATNCSALRSKSAAAFGRTGGSVNPGTFRSSNAPVPRSDATCAIRLDAHLPNNRCSLGRL